MDAHLWHAHARFQPTRPARIHPDDLQRLSTRALEQRKDEARAWVSRLQLDPPANAHIRNALSRTIENNRTTPPGAKDILAITAPNTAGKSTLARSWALDHYRSTIGRELLREEAIPVWRPTRHIEADYVPVVWMNLPAGAARKEFNTEFLKFLGHRSEGVLRTTNDRLTATIARQGVRLIVVDDIHLLRTQHRDGQTVLDHLKYINTVLGEHHGTLLLVGANLHGSDIAADPQINGRMRFLELPIYAIDSAEQKRDWQRLLHDAEKQLRPFLPLADKGVLVHRAGLIWRRTQGYLGDLGNLLRQATAHAIDNEAWNITLDVLEKVPLSARAEAQETSLLSRGRRTAGRAS